MREEEKTRRIPPNTRKGKKEGRRNSRLGKERDGIF